jgi:hypothetical protein
MAQPQTISTLKDTLGFPFRSPDWQGRFVVGSVLLLGSFIIPVLPAIFVYGYVMEVLRQAVRGEQVSLPAWEDWGRFWKDGWRAFLVGLAFLAPGVIVLCGGSLLYFLGSLSLPAFENSGGDLPGFAVLLFFLSFGVFFLSLFGGTLLSIVGVVPLPFATAHLAAQNELAAAFRPSEWWPALRRVRADYLIAWVVVTGLVGVWYLAAGLAYYSLVLCCLVPLVGAPFGLYISLVAAALFGETYREAVESPPKRAARSQPPRKRAR